MGTFKNSLSEPIELMKVEEGLLVVGVRARLFNRIGEIKNIDLPEEGSEVQKGEECVSITGAEEDVHVRSPIDGVILEVNELFSEELEKHRKNPSHWEWVLKIEPSDPEDLIEFED